MSPDSRPTVAVAVPAPLRRLFDYRLGPDTPPPAPGARVLVPFGRGRRVGIAVGPAAGDHDRPLKEIIEVLDPQPLLEPTLLRLAAWCADYYQHPIGEVLQAVVPGSLRKARAAPAAPGRYRLTATGRDPSAVPANAVRQRRVLEVLGAAGAAGMPRAELSLLMDRPGEILARLCEKKLVERFEEEPVSGHGEPGPPLNGDQRDAVAACEGAAGIYATFLLHGVTGSGKTEVYLECARRCIERGRQVLVLVPEIALTPQLVQRFARRLARPMAVLHSALSDGQRQRGWLDAGAGRCDIVLGTRSAVFANLPRLGLVIVDEEHDPSYKQQDGFRYHARDVAIKRASLVAAPVLLGSATPSLESYHNARQGRYRLLQLPDRAGAASLPRIVPVDCNRWPTRDGLSPPLLQAIGDRLTRGEQALVYLNRRGFAPVVLCGCGWRARCLRCDACMTLHRAAGRIQCHHCGASGEAPEHCPECGGDDLYHAGIGTQRVEETLAGTFPTARVLRIDRDTSSSRGALEEQLGSIARGEVDIVVGTQLLSKGHDFPGITLVGVLNADQGMYSVDFRATERLFQSVTQVAGRAGRADRPGTVLIQTRFPGHPCIDAICRHDYRSFADSELELRRQTGMPPWGYIALLRAEAVSPRAALEFLEFCVRSSAALPGGRGKVEVLDPVAAPMERRAGRFRAQLMLQSPSRGELRRVAGALVDAVSETTRARRVRWSLDIDPADLY